MQKIPKSLTDRLHYLSQLEENWDSYGNVPISPVAIEETKIVLRKVLAISGSNFPNPFISPIPDGGIGLEWKLLSGKELLIDISPERRLVL